MQNNLLYTIRSPWDFASSTDTLSAKPQAAKSMHARSCDYKIDFFIPPTIFVTI